MSTRCTIAFDDTDFHLYQEVLDNNSVYLRLESGDWDASLETATLDWRDGDSKRPTLHVRMDVTLWRRIVEGWCESHWGKNPDIDHTKPDFNFDNNKWLNALKARKEEDKQDE